MSSTVQKLVDKGLVTPPRWLPNSIQYEAICGSVSYGVSNDRSDLDVLGFCVPLRTTVFPHLAGEILGFGTPINRFNQWQKHHVIDDRGGKGQEYDLTIYSIVRYFHLVMQGNPNMVDSLFAPVTSILHCTQLGQKVREARKMFLHRGCWFRYKGYSYAQVTRMCDGKPVGKRKAEVEKYGFSLKMAYHAIRLLGEIEMILVEGDLDLQRNKEQLKSIRRGEWSLDQVVQYFEKKEAELETVYLNSTLPDKPNERAIKRLLLECLEMHYGSLEAAFVDVNKERDALREIAEICGRVGV